MIYPRLAEAMTERGWKETDLQMAIKVGPNRLVNLLNGRTQFTDLEKCVLSGELNVNESELFERRK